MDGTGGPGEEVPGVLVGRPPRERPGPAERQRKALETMICKALGDETAVKAYRAAALWTQADIVGLQAAIVMVPPRNSQGDVDGRAVSVRRKLLADLSVAIERRRADAHEIPDAIEVTVGIPGGTLTPDVPVYFDDVEAALARAQDADRRRQG